MQTKCNSIYTPIPSITDYVPPSPSNMDYTSSIVQLDEFLSNVFGTDCDTPVSAHEYMHSLQNELGHFTPLGFNLMFSQDVDENNPSLHDIPHQCLCQNPRCNKRRLPCGTGHHYGD